MPSKVIFHSFAVDPSRGLIDNGGSILTESGYFQVLNTDGVPTIINSLQLGIARVPLLK